jgi:hypothetical protein
LQVGAGRGEVRVPQLALDQRQRDPLAQQLDSMRMAELVRGYAPADPGRDGGAMQLKASGAGRPRVAARRSGDHAEQRATGSVARSATHDSRAAQPHASIPTRRRRSPLPCLTKIDPRRCSRSVSVSDSASLIRSPARQSTTINPFRRLPYGAPRATRMIAMISSTVGGVSRVTLPLVRRRPTDVKLRQGRRRPTAAGSVEQLHIRRHGSLP